MNSEAALLLGCLMALLSCSREGPIDPFTESWSSRPDDSSDIVDRTGSAANKRTEKVDFSEDIEDLAKNNLTDRLKHARMLTSTTLGYDEWWFLTTSRPVSYKDFPGRPGVASWKEISPGSSDDNRKSRQMTSPTAAGVTGRGGKDLPHCLLIILPILLAGFLPSFRWT